MTFHKLSTLLLLAICGCCSLVQAQQYTVDDHKAIRSYENAIKAFDSGNLDLVLAFTEEALERSPQFLESYLLQFEVYATRKEALKAEQALERALEIDPDFFPNAWYFLGAVEMTEAKYAEAETHLNRFLTYSSTNPELRAQAEKMRTNAAFAQAAMQHPVAFVPENMGSAINTSLPEYYPAISTDGSLFIFTRLVDDPRAYQGKNEEFFSSRSTAGEWMHANSLRGVNSVFNEGAPTLSADGRTLVFTACELMGDYGPGRKGYGSCDLFMSRQLGGEWLPPQNLGPEVNTPWWETQPSLSADGNTLYFVRGKPARTGVQSQDIYVTQKKADGAWSVPAPLPASINSGDREESVHIHPDGRTLYFSSNGHPGMGGLDLFVAYQDSSGRWSAPENLGYPLNTAADENSLLVSARGEVAFFASDRAGGFGDLDLYSFELPVQVRPTPVTYVKGRVYDGESGEPLQADIDLSHLSQSSDKRYFESDARTGQFLVALPTDASYAMIAKSPGYLLHSESFTVSGSEADEGFLLDIPLYKIAPGKAVVLENIFFDLDKAELKPESKPELDELVRFLSSNPGVHIRVAGHTDNQGSTEYNIDLSERRAAAVKTYLVERGGISGERITTKGYGDSQPIANNATAEGRAKNRRTEFSVTASD